MLKSTLAQRGRRVVLLPVLVAFFAWVLGTQVEARPGGGQSYKSSGSSRSSSSSGSSRSYSGSSSSRSYSGSSSSSGSRSYSSGSSSSSSYSGSSSYGGSSSTVYVPTSTYSSSGSGCNGFTWVVLILIIGVLLYLYLRGRKSSGPVERATIEVDSSLAQEGIAALKGRDESFDPQAFVERTKTVVAKVNEAWLSGHMGPTRRLISDGVFTRFNTQLGLLKADGLRNVMSDWRVVSAKLPDKKARS